MPTPRQWFRDALADFRASRTGNQRRQRIRDDVAALINAAQDWQARFDAQENAAARAFADDRPGQFNTFVDTLSPVEPDQTP
jgi:hypothetical protein